MKFPRFQSLWYGITLPLRAGRLIVSSGRLIALSLLPVTLTLALYGFVVLRVQDLARAAINERLMVWGWDPHGWGAWGLAILANLILLIVGAFTFSAVASIIASPFNDFLAEATERHAEPPLPAVPPMGLAAKAELIVIDLGKTIAAGIAMIVAILLSWIPFVNVVAFALAFMLVSFQYISYPQTRRGHGLGYGLKFLVHHPWASLGFGAALTFFFAIPLLSSLMLPLAVVGGTLLVARAQGGQFPLK
jgi:CysZ protein